jgi:hypothetical protein
LTLASWASIATLTGLGRNLKKEIQKKLTIRVWLAYQHPTRLLAGSGRPGFEKNYKKKRKKETNNAPKLLRPQSIKLQVWVPILVPLRGCNQKLKKIKIKIYNSNLPDLRAPVFQLKLRPFATKLEINGTNSYLQGPWPKDKTNTSKFNLNFFPMGMGIKSAIVVATAVTLPECITKLWTKEREKPLSFLSFSSFQKN